MAVLVCGALAFDTITAHEGRFASQLLPDQLHNINVSFVVPTLRREFGGCAGNIAYTLHQLGGAPVVMAALGSDGADYLRRLESWGTDTSLVLHCPEAYTAQAMIITDVDHNQITAFHPGAMAQTQRIALPPGRGDLTLAIIAPDNREAMLAHAGQVAAAGIPFVLDPGQSLPEFDAADLQCLVAQASWIAVNDYEARLLCERMGTTLEALSQRPGLRGVIVTQGAAGCVLWQQGRTSVVAGVAADPIVDPTGCGDAFRGALLYGLAQGWVLERCVMLGNRVGALKMAQRGGQNHAIPPGFLDAAQSLNR